MNRRDFLGATGFAVAGACTSLGASRDEDPAIKRAVEDYYAAYRGLDKAKYRACLTDDYLLLENGALLAYAVYFLASEITDQQGRRQRRWLESMILRRSSAGWRTALLHSTPS